MTIDKFDFHDFEIRARRPDTTNEHLAQIYTIGVAHGESGFRVLQSIQFQHCSVKEVGRNGLSEDVLVRVVIDRLERHQDGDYPHDKNLEALGLLQRALFCLEERRENPPIVEDPLP